MEMQNSEADELLEAQAHIFNHVLSHIGSLSLKCAIELGILEAIDTHGQAHPLPLSQLISHLSILPSRVPYLRRLMRLLAHMGYFTIKNHSKADEKEEEDAYSLTMNSKILLKSSPTSMASWLLTFLDPNWMSVYNALPKWYQQSQVKAPIESIYGCSLWDIARLVPEHNIAFNESMACDTRVIATALVSKFKDSFQGLTSLVDVGGGNGTFAIALSTAFPHIQCTVYDLPHVLSTVPETTTVKAQGGDMFQHIPSADAVFLKLILHDWTDEECVKILKLCREAIPASGKVMIVDIVLNKNNKQDSSKGTNTQLYWDIMMLTCTRGKEREENEWKKIFIDAGFRDYKITPLGLRSMIEVFP